MKLLQMIDSLRWGGTQKMQIILAKSIQPLNIDLTIVHLYQEANVHLVDELERYGARVIGFPFAHLYSPVQFVKLYNFIRKEKFDLIHAHLTYANILGSVIGWMTGTPAIASLRTADENHFNKLRTRFEKIVLEHISTRVMGNGYMVAATHQPKLRRVKIDVLPNSVELIPPLPEDERNKLRADIAGGDTSRPIILAVGRFAVSKGYPEMVEAFEIVKKEYPRAVLAIAGGGTQFDLVRRMVRERNLDDSVFLLGVRNDAMDLVSACDIYASASHFEGMPNSVMEAMAAGKPVAVTRVGDVPNIVVEGTGLVSPPHQPKELAKNIIRLLSDESLRRRLGENARSRIEKYYSPKPWVNDLMRLYSLVTPTAQPYIEKLPAKKLQEA